MYYRIDGRDFNAEDQIVLDPHWQTSETWKDNIIHEDWSKPSLARAINEIQQNFPNGLSEYGIYTLTDPAYWLDAFYPSPNGYTRQELVLEETRKQHYPQIQISRFTAIYCTQNLEDVKKFKDMCEHNGFIYEVEGHCCFKSDMQLLGKSSDQTQLVETAHKYWQGKPSDNPLWECLLESPVTIIRKIS